LYTAERAKKLIPKKNFISLKIVADFLIKFTPFTDEDSGDIFCKFY